MAAYTTPAATVTLAWDPSAGTNVITGYKVYYGPGSGAYTNSVTVGNVTNATVTGLVAGAKYYFAATATDNQGLESVYSTEISYTIPLPAINQPPTLDPIANVTINEGAGTQTVALTGVGPGATNETQTVMITATSSNPGVIPNPTVNYTSPSASGTLTFAPLAYAFGSATITVTANDGGASNNITTRTFTVTVNPVNQPPTLNALANVTIDENAAAQTVNLSGISTGATNETQTLTVTANSSNPGLIPSPTVTYTSPNATGSLTFTPVAYAFGAATITVTVNDGGASNNTVVRTFTVTVKSVNQAPTLNALANLTINENAGLQTVNLGGIGTGASNELQTLAITAASSNPSLIPTPTVTYTSPNATGTLTFTPAPMLFGSSTITVTVNDGGASNNITTRTFTVTVIGVNQPPTLAALNDLTLVQDDPQQIVNLSGIGSGASNEIQTLTVTAASSKTTVIPNPTVTYTSPNATGSLTFKPVAGAYGTSTISVSVNDGAASNNVVTRTFQVTVDGKPTISTIADVAIQADTATAALPFTISDPETAATNLTVYALSSNTALVPTANLVLAGTTGSRTVTVTPLAGKSGYSDITITVSDGVATSSANFRVTVNAKPSAPANLRIVSSQ